MPKKLDKYLTSYLIDSKSSLSPSRLSCASWADPLLPPWPVS